MLKRPFTINDFSHSKRALQIMIEIANIVKHTNVQYKFSNHQSFLSIEELGTWSQQKNERNFRGYYLTIKITDNELQDSVLSKMSDKILFEFERMFKPAQQEEKAFKTYHNDSINTFVTIFVKNEE